MDVSLLSKNDILLESCDALQLQHNEAEFTLYAEIRGDVAIHDGDALGFYDVDGLYRIFEIATRTLRQPDNIWVLDCVDKGAFELMGDAIEERRARDTGVNDYVGRLLEGTRFDLVSTASGTGTMTAYYESVWSALIKVQGAYGVRCIPYYTITGGIVTGRHVKVEPAGTTNRGRIFELGDDLTGLDITYDDSGIKTALYGRGQGIEIEGGDSSTDPAYGRRLTFADVVWSTAGGDPVDKPEGQEWIGDPGALAMYGRDGRHRYGFVVFDSTTDPDELIQQTWDALQEQKDPIISITGTVRDTERIFGRSHEAVRMHDTVLVRMRRSSAYMDISAVISGIIRDYVDPDNTRVTIGNALPTSGDVIRDLSAKMTSHEDRAAVWDRANAFDLDGAMDVMNNQIRSTVGNWYTDPDTGAIMLVSSDGTKAMRLTGAGWQIANSKIGNAWQWRTAATGAGIVADEIKTGTLSANLIKAGIISDLAGKNYWDMTTGEFQLSATTKIDDDGGTIGDLVEDAITAVDVEYAKGDSSSVAPVSGWSTSSPAWEAGKYIWQRTATTDGEGTTSYSEPTCIQGAKGADGSGVTVSSIEYGTSNSASVTPSSWTPTAPTSLTKGTWLWIKTTYSDTSVATTKTYIGTDGDDGKSVYVYSASKTDGITTVVLKDTDGNTTTMTIADGEDGDNGQPGADGLSGYVHTAWANSSDGSQDFSTSVSTNKKYLGVYTDNTAADSQSYLDYSWSLIKGANGTSVTVSSIQYGTSSSASVEPLSWSTTAPTSLTKGVWLWIKTNYSDSTSAVTKTYIGTDGDDGKSVYVYSASKTDGITTVVLKDTDGNTTTMTIADGEDGDNGQPGADGLSGYVHTAWANSSDGSQDFSTSVSTNKKYLGVYTDNTAADSQSYLDYSWSLIKGAKGDTGATGTGVSAVIEQYYLSTSNQTQIGGSWSTDQPVWASGKYIWTRSAVTWTTGSTTYTDPVLAKAINGANESVNTLDNSLNQQGVFNRLTNNGQTQGIYLSNGLLYVNATYIGTGTLSADRISAGSISFGKLKTGTVFSSVSDAGMTVSHGSAGDAYTTLDASGLRMYNSSNALIGGLYIPTGQQAVKMGATSLFNPTYPNFSAQLDRQWDGESAAYMYMLSFYRQDAFAFGIGVEDDPNFGGGFVMDKNGDATTLGNIIDTANNWHSYDPITWRPTAGEVEYASGELHLYQDGGEVYLNSPGDIYLIMHVNGNTLTLRMSDVYDILHP